MVNIPDTSGILDPVTGAVSMYGEDPLVTALVPALMVALLMLSAVSRLWE